MSDPRLKSADTRVAYVIMRHVNWRTRTTRLPLSIETISEEACLSRRHTAQAIKRLKDTGWLLTRRTMGASIYGFSDQNVDGLIDHEIVLKEAREARREAKRTLAYHNTRDVHPSAYPKPKGCAPECISDVHPSAYKHLSLTPLKKEGLSIESKTIPAESQPSGQLIVLGHIRRVTTRRGTVEYGAQQ